MTIQEMVFYGRVAQAASHSNTPHEFIKSSGVMPVMQYDRPQANMRTSRLLRSKNARNALLSHCNNADEFGAAIFAWNHPERLKFSRFSELGETYDLTNPRYLRKYRNKRRAGIQGYNEYVLKYKRKTYIVKTEIERQGFEIPYHIVKK